MGRKIDRLLAGASLCCSSGRYYAITPLSLVLEGFTLVERAPKVSASFSSRTTTSLHHLRIPQRLHKTRVCFKHLLNLPDALQIPVRESKQETESPQPIVHRARKKGNKIKLKIPRADVPLLVRTKKKKERGSLWELERALITRGTFPEMERSQRHDK